MTLATNAGSNPLTPSIGGGSNVANCVPIEIAKYVGKTTTMIYEKLTHPRSGYMTEKSGLDFSLQPNAHQKIYKLIKDNLDELKETIDEKTSIELDDALKSEDVETNVMTEMKQSLEFCSNTYNDRLAAVENEISDINDEIEKYKRKINEIKNSIIEEDKLTETLEKEIANLEGNPSRNSKIEK